MSHRPLPSTKWYEAIYCHYGTTGMTKTEESLGIKTKRHEARRLGTERGLRIMSEEAYKNFRENGGLGGCYIVEHLVVFTGRDRMSGRVVSGLRVALAPNGMHQQASLTVGTGRQQMAQPPTRKWAESFDPGP